MKFELILYLVAAVFVSATITDELVLKNNWKDAGVVAALDMKAVRSAKHFHWNYLMSLLNGVSLPDLSFHNGHLNSNVFYITEDSKNVKAESLQDSTTIRLSATDLQAGLISQNFTYDLFFFSALCTLEARFTHVNFSISFDIVSQKDEDDQESFAIAVNSVNIDLPAEHMDITIHGNYFTNLANTFKGLYVNTLRKQMENHLENIIRSKFPAILNRDARAKETVTQISEDVSLDWHLAGRPENQQEKLVFGVLGLTSLNETLIAAQMYESETTSLPRELNFNFDDKVQNFQAYIRKVGIKEDNDMILKLLNHSQHIDVFQMFRLSNLQVIDQKDYFQLSAHASFIAPKWQPKFTPHTLPHIGGKWSFWHEHLNPAGVHTRKLSKPLVYTLHIWLQQYHDKFGVIKMMDKVYTPMLYKLLGEKNPEEEH